MCAFYPSLKKVVLALGMFPCVGFIHHLRKYDSIGSRRSAVLIKYHHRTSYQVKETFSSRNGYVEPQNHASLLYYKQDLDFRCNFYMYKKERKCTKIRQKRGKTAILLA